jgi:hypothetical protein
MSDKLGAGRGEGETTESLRAGSLRKLLRARFGHAKAKQTLAMLWREAPASPGLPEPSEDESSRSRGVWECPRSMLAWRREMNERNIPERDWLIENGLWCG